MELVESTDGFPQHNQLIHQLRKFMVFRFRVCTGECVCVCVRERERERERDREAAYLDHCPCVPNKLFS